MAINQFEFLPGILAELQDGGLAVTETAVAPRVLILGTSVRGPSSLKVPVTRDQESEVQFGLEGSLIRGMYEARNGGSVETYLYRINTQSAILYGVGTDDQVTNPTSIETFLKDGSAADLYFVRYTTPTSLGPNATLGRLIIKNALDVLVYDSNPGGTFLNTGEVIVSGVFDGGADIGALGDPNDFVSMREVAQDRTSVTAEALGAAAGGAETFDLANSDVLNGTITVYADGVELDEADWDLLVGTGPGGVDQIDVLIGAGLVAAQVMTADYEYDADPLYNLRDGKDGVDPSKMELYEALEEAYTNLEGDEIAHAVPMEAFLDDKNIVDGDTLVLSSNESIPVGRRFPIPGSPGDGLGLLHKEEYDGTIYSFWDTDDDGIAEIWPEVGLASSTTKIDGSALEASDFNEVNFAYQLANFCFRLTVNDNFCLGVIGTSMPFSNSVRDVSRWIGKKPTLDTVTNEVVVNGTGLLGNKWMAGSTTREAGFLATFSGELPTSADFNADTDVVKDRAGNMVDIGKYLTIPVFPLIFFNNFDTTGTGYQANMTSFIAGVTSVLPVNSSPLNKTITGVNAPFRIFKPKLNLLSEMKYMAVRNAEGVLKISDAPTAARSVSDYTRLTTVRIVAGAIDIIREVADPYIGEPNTRIRREALQTSIKKELADYQLDGNLNRFEVQVLASRAQEISGDMLVELVLVPVFETRKITILASLARQ